MTIERNNDSQAPEYQGVWPLPENEVLWPSEGNPGDGAGAERETRHPRVLGFSPDRGRIPSGIETASERWKTIRCQNVLKALSTLDRSAFDMDETNRRPS